MVTKQRHTIVAKNKVWLETENSSASEKDLGKHAKSRNNFGFSFTFRAKIIPAKYKCKKKK